MMDAKEEKSVSMKEGSKPYNEKSALEIEAVEEYDPWALPEMKDTGKPWEEMTQSEKFRFVLLAMLKLIFFLGFLYLFICSLDFLSSAFRLLGGRAAGEVFRKNTIFQNPVAGVMIGVLATVLVQSSSTSTSIVVSMVGAGLLDVRIAIPIIMGANIGTSVTNTIVAMGQITEKADFRRAFAGATVHDMFNWLAVIILLPVELASQYLYRLSSITVESMQLQKYSDGKTDLLKAITKPFTKLIVQVDKSGIEKIATSDANSKEVQLLKICCKSVKNTTSVNASSICIEECEYIFKNTGLSETIVGAILLVLSLMLLCSCLFAIVKLLNSLLQGNVRKVIKKFMNAHFPGKAKYFTGYIAILIGCGMTILVQSSSIFTSAMTPLVGVGVVSLDRMYPLTLGSNIGTTTTSILAALAQDADKMKDPLQVSFCHLYFNLSGILLLYPIPYLRFPIPLAKFLGTETEKYRWFAPAYLIMMFFLMPAFVFGLSLAGVEAVIGVLVPIVVLVMIIVTITVIQNKKPKALPPKMRTWDFLPEPMRSLKPYDNVIQKVFVCNKCCKTQTETVAEPELDDFKDKNTPSTVVHVTRM